ncbi:adhesion regulating molecule [Desarmillaria ectypa]|nr:adhesion regulating molecule [Desarmillaria ectypa]
MADILLAFKAGKALRREGTNMVDPVATKGAIMITNGEDGLLHFIWKNRVSNDVEEDLILFPSDASFIKAAGRTYVLKFSSSNQRHFFWMQDASPDRDDEFVRNVNGLLEDPEFIPTWGSPSTSAQASTSSQVASSSSAASQFQATPEQLEQLQSILTSMTTGAGGAQSGIPEMSLSDILTPENITPLFITYPSLIPALFPHLPPDLPTPPTPEAVQRVISSPQFRAAVSNFDQALRTGLLGGLVRGLGLPEEAGTGLGPFLRAVQEQADRQNQAGEDGMDTD